MAQYIVRVTMAIDAKDHGDCDSKVIHMLQPMRRCADPESPMLEWMFDLADVDEEVSVASFKMVKPIRGLVGGGIGKWGELNDEYERARAAFLLENNNGT